MAAIKVMISSTHGSLSLLIYCEENRIIPLLGTHLILSCLTN